MSEPHDDWTIDGFRKGADIFLEPKLPADMLDHPAKMPVNLAFTPPPSPSYDWEAECRGLGYMILTIAQHYEALNMEPNGKRRRKPLLGGDSELLREAVLQAKEWVDGPLREELDRSTNRPLPAAPETRFVRE